ncbi:MAG: hypothetical protein JW715_06440 [Sedimentisphaerales bacterium]|nr:hypothetical protein [Sedimentisphaerales bacterium]
MNKRKSIKKHISVPGLICIGFFVLYCIIGLFGYGNDVDTYAMIRQGQKVLSSHGYFPSRPPGYFVSEIIIGFTSMLGSHYLSNMFSALLGAISIYIFYTFIKRYFDEKVSLLITLVVALNPYYIIAASSSMDYIYSIFFCFCGICCLDRRKYFIAAIIFATSLSARLSNSLIVFAIYVGYLIFYLINGDKKAFTKLVVSIPLAMIITILFYVPSYIAYGNSFQFLEYGIGDWNYFGHFARFIYKNIYLMGFFSTIFIFITIIYSLSKRKKLDAIPFVMKIGLFTLIIHEILFLKVPIEISYLLPILFVLVPIWAFMVRKNVVFISIMLLLTVSYNFVNVELLTFERDYVKQEAVDANVDISINTGVLVDDIVKRWCLWVVPKLTQDDLYIISAEKAKNI